MPEIYHALLDAICGSQSEHLFKKVRLSKRLSKIKIEIMTTRQTGGLHAPIRG